MKSRAPNGGPPGRSAGRPATIRSAEFQAERENREVVGIEESGRSLDGPAVVAVRLVDRNVAVAEPVAAPRNDTPGRTRDGAFLVFEGADREVLADDDRLQVVDRRRIALRPLRPLRALDALRPLRAD